MRIGKTRFFRSLKYILPAFVLLSVGALAIIKNSSAATCVNHYICYVAETGGQITSRYDSNPVSYDDGNAWYAGNGARAVANEGYVFVAWKDESGTEVSTNAVLIPCASNQQGCDSSSISIQEHETYTAYFERQASAPTAATETITLGANVDADALSGKAINLTLSGIESSAPMPSGTQGTISQNTTSVSFGEITYDEAGTWRYRISLQTPSGVAVDAGNLEVRVRATLDETNNAIVTEKTYYKNDSELTSESDFFVHVSKIAPTPAEDSITLGVFVDEGALEGNEAISLSLNGTPAPSTTSGSIDKDTTSVSFGEMRFTEPGSHRYSISINNPYTTAQPDAVNLEVKIDATLDETNNAIVTQKTYYKNDSEISEANFVLNIFIVAASPLETYLQFPEVIDPEADLSNFSATMTSVGDAPAMSKQDGEIIDNETIDFGDVTFSKPGHNEYIIELKNGDKTRKLTLTADIEINRSDNRLVMSDSDFLDEEGNSISYEDLLNIIAELLATEPAPDDPDSGDSSDDSETPNTGDSFNFAIPGAIGATIFALGAALVVVKRR